MRQFPDHFIDADTPASEWPAGFDVPVPEPEAQPADGISPLGPITIKPAPTPEESVWCISPFRKRGRKFELGGCYRKDDPVVLEEPERFEVRRRYSDVLAEERK